MAAAGNLAAPFPLMAPKHKMPATHQPLNPKCVGGLISTSPTKAFLKLEKSIWHKKVTAGNTSKLFGQPQQTCTPIPRHPSPLSSIAHTLLPSFTMCASVQMSQISGPTVHTMLICGKYSRISGDLRRFPAELFVRQHYHQESHKKVTSGK